jgi:hypothetical protein
MMPRLDAFTRAYLDTALWSTTDNADENGGEPLDKNHSIGDIDPATLNKMIADCADFQERFGRLIDDGGQGDEQAGHDFWLTRNGHGAGFWDGDWPKPQATELTNASKTYGEFDLYIGDDGVIYGSPLETRVARESRRGVVRANSLHVADFSTLPDLIKHAKSDLGATHVSGHGSETRVYFPRGDGQYEEASVWQKGNYWHAEGPGARQLVRKPPAGAKPITQGGMRWASETTARRWEDVPQEELLSLAHAHQWSAQRDAAQAELEKRRGRGGRASEATDQRSRWPDWMILESVEKGQGMTPQAKNRAFELAARGYIDITGTWKLTDKGQDALARRIEKVSSIGYLGPHAPEKIRRGVVRDYVVIDRHDRTVAGPFKHSSDARDAAGTAGVVKFVPSAKKVSEARRNSPALPPHLHDAYEWITSANEWEDALSSPEEYAREAAANAAEHGHSNITESDLLDVIHWFAKQRSESKVSETRRSSHHKPKRR